MARSLVDQENVGPSGKAPLLLKWACQELCQAYNKKNRNVPSHVTTSSLWQFLSSVLVLLSEDSAVQSASALNVYIFQVRTVCYALCFNTELCGWVHV